MLPDFEEAAVDALENMIGKMPPLTSLIEDVMRCSAGKTISGMTEELLALIFKDMPEKYMPEKLEEKSIAWKCDCSRERMKKALVTIGKKDLEEIIEEDGQAEAYLPVLYEEIFFCKR